MKPIIAATDFSDAANDAVARAAQLASAHAAELCIIHALGGGEWTQRVFLDLPAGYRDRVRQAADLALAAECERLRGPTGPTTCESLLIDDLLSPPESQRSLVFAGLTKDRIEAHTQQGIRRVMTELERFSERVADGRGQIVPALREGHPERALAEIIAEAQLDLLVLGVTGRSELEVGLLGSISAHAAANASCDVLLVPATAARA
jgi:nucleotide-binding universal stress UspA family protein